jgi:hypothetical protein
MPATAITVAQDATLTGGLCLVGIEARSNAMLLEQEAQARAQAPWHRLMEQALTGSPSKVLMFCSNFEPP